MLTLQQSFYHLSGQLAPLYDEREAIAIAHEYLNHLTGLDRTGRLLHKDHPLTDEQGVAFENDCVRLQSGIPLQYVTNSAWFMGREFYVDERVLIPRPETEELVDRVVKECSGKSNSIRILDMGTGSGCIAISLASRLSHNHVVAIDKSQGALEVAQKNARELKIEFVELDFLDERTWDQLPMFDLVVSNPPYIPLRKSAEMHSNVKDYEPGMALFVANDDPLVFYRAIANFCKTHLSPQGAIFCELEESMATACREMFVEMGYANAIVHKDMHGNNRIIQITT